MIHSKESDDQDAVERVLLELERAVSARSAAISQSDAVIAARAAETTLETLSVQLEAAAAQDALMWVTSLLIATQRQNQDRGRPV